MKAMRAIIYYICRLFAVLDGPNESSRIQGVILFSLFGYIVVSMTIEAGFLAALKALGLMAGVTLAICAPFGLILWLAHWYKREHKKRTEEKTDV